MSNDLISRSALKDRLKELLKTEPSSIYGCGLRLAIENIDNAPTVAVNCKDCDGYEAGYSAGLKDAEIPQGEWVRKEDVIRYIATQYSEHNELVPVWLNIGDLNGGAE